MTRRILVAVATSFLFAAGCAGSNSAQKGGGGGGGKPADSEESDELPPLPQAKLHGPKKRIGIVDFENASTEHRWGGGKSGLADAARDVTTEALVKSGGFVVIEREQIAQVLKEQGLGMTGAISPQTAAKAGKLLGLQALITGKITDFNAKEEASGFGGFYQARTRIAHARVSLRITDATTGEIWTAESGEGTAKQKSTMVMGGGQVSHDETIGKKALYKAIYQMIGKILAKSDAKPWTSTVAKVDKGKRVYIVAGSDLGLEAGTELTVRRMGEEITDPTTGQVIGHELGQTLGTLQVAEHLNEKLSVCIPTKGAGFNVGDVVVVSPPAAQAAQAAPTPQG
jgi:curli biogenesis system outer membrane secretion channel CsgG